MASVLRSAPPSSLRASGQGERPTLHGHFAVFNRWTEIDSIFEGRFLERMAPGAFTRTMADDRAGMRVLFQHGRDPYIGMKPLGSIMTLREDEQGASYEVPLYADAPYIDHLLPGLRDGAYGASFRFRVVREEFVQRPERSDYNPEGIAERTVKEAEVFEFGPVTFAAYPEATAGVRANAHRATDAHGADAHRANAPRSLTDWYRQTEEASPRGLIAA